MTDPPFRVRTAHLDLPALAGAFSRRLRDAGVPVTAERAARFAHAVTGRARLAAAGPALDGARCSSPDSARS